MRPASCVTSGARVEPLNTFFVYIGDSRSTASPATRPLTEEMRRKSFFVNTFFVSTHTFKPGVRSSSVVEEEAIPFNAFLSETGVKPL